MGEFLHIMQTGNIRVVRNFMNFVNANFDNKEHTFLIVGNYKDQLPENAINIANYDSKKIIEAINNCDRAIFHSLSMSTAIKMRLVFDKKLMQKIVWLAWGMDLYERNYGSNVTAFIKKTIDVMLKNKVKYFIGLLPPDIEVFKDRHNKNAKTFFAPYAASGNDINPVYKTEPDIIKIKEKISKGETVNILIGHQANSILNHKQVIDWILRFKEENIHLFIPLSYGNRSYGEEISQYAKEKFGEKVTVLLDFMKIDDYMKILAGIDIAVFHTERQIALGNVKPLLYMQKKMYIHSNGVMYKYFGSDNMQIQKSEDLETISFAEFTNDVDMSGGTEFIANLNDYQKSVARWEDVFKGIL